MNFAAREEDVLRFWEQEDIRQKAQDLHTDGELFTVYDGPPTANGKPHIGHVLTRAIKDVIPRHRRMKGHHIEFKAGWDTHGLPVELEVERSLGLNGKPEIEAYGVEDFVKNCKESVWQYRDNWEEMSERVAYSADMENPYVTYENNYIESEWWALKKMWDRDLIYNGHKIIPYCSRCGTALSSHEVAQGYKDVKDSSIFVRFKVKNEANTWLSAWTTTPWTLPSNVGLAVNPSESYILIEVDAPAEESQTPLNSNAYKPVEGVKPRYWIAEDLVEKLFEDTFTILETKTGTELAGLEYEPLLPYATALADSQGKKAFYLIADNYVTMEEGTGIVHLAPAFGEDDYRLGRQNGLPFVQLVSLDGALTEEVTDFAGQWVKDADPAIIKKLDEDGLLVLEHKYEHSYPHCWRCDTPLIYYARNTWFIEMTKLRDDLLKNNKTVNWLPASVRDGRFGHFLENVVDWGLSRERYWGTPLPVWQCGDCDHEHMIGSIAELKEMSPNCPDEIELHKPYIDEVNLNCPECDGLMQRVPEVIDGWFDSGAMPFAQYHYPFENKELFEEHFPADFISEAQDQTRGWFYSMMAIGTVLFDQSPYKNVIMMGLVQDKDGQKMSKHLGNVVDPMAIMDTYGADAFRWYFYANSNPWLPSRFSEEAVTELQRKFMSTIWNTLGFFTMYAGLDEYDPQNKNLPEPRYSQMDLWLSSRLQSLILTVDKGLSEYDITRSARAIQDFVEVLSNWYVRRSRDRFWGADMTSDKTAAYGTLFTTLDTLARLIAPFTPFLAEAIWQELRPGHSEDEPVSVHLAAYPTADNSKIDLKLEEDMQEVQLLVTLGHAARNSAQIKTRQPLSRIMISSQTVLDDDMLEQVKEELNIKHAEYITDAGQLLDYEFKPQLRTLGKRLGSLLPRVRNMLGEIDGHDALEELKRTGSLELKLADESVVLSEEDLIIETSPRSGFTTAQDQNVTVALDLQLSERLIQEGLMREIVSKIQTMRKNLDYQVEDRINVYYSGDDEVRGVMNLFGEEIKRQVLAIKLVQGEGGEGRQTWQLNGQEGSFALEQIKH